MRIIQIIWIVISIALLIMAALGLLDSYVSFKYEVEEVQMKGHLSEALDDKRILLKNLIFILWYAAIYLIINIAITFRSLFKN